MRILRDAKYVTSTVFIGLVMAAARSVLVLRFLGPALSGAWKSAQLLDTFSEVARLGVSRGVGIRVSVLEGQGETAEADRIAAAAGAYLLWSGGFMWLITFILSLIVSNPDLRLSLRFVSVILALTQPYYFLRDLAGARQLFVLRAKETVLRATTDCVFAILGARFFRIEGLGSGTFLGALITALYLKQQQHFRFKIRPDFRRVKELMRIGIPFSMAENGYEVLRRLDLLMMALILGHLYVGYYGISALIMDFAMLLAQRGLSQVLSPHLLREFGRRGSFSAVVNYYEIPARLFAYVLPPVLGVGAFFIPDFVRLILPKFLPGAAAAQVTMWILFFIALHYSVNSFLVAAERMGSVLKLYAALIPLGAGAQFVVMKSGLGLVGAAWTTLGILTAVGIGEIYLARRSCGHSLAEISRFVVVLHFPFVAAVLLHALVERLTAGMTFPLLLGAPVRSALFLVFYAPLLATYEIKFSILRRYARRSEATA